MLSALIIIFVSIALSAFFAGMEIAFLSSNKLKLEIQRKDNRAFNYIAGIFESNPGQYIATILVGNNVALVIYSLQMSHFLHSLWNLDDNLSFFLETLISTLVIIFTAEFIPKTMVRLSPNFYYKAFAVPAYLFYLIFYPISKITSFVSNLIVRMTGFGGDGSAREKKFDRSDLAHLLVEVSEAEQAAEEETGLRLFQNALEFSELLVRDCMVPRVEIEAVDQTTSIEELTDRFIATSYSRLLVYEENIDRIIGYVNTKSLFGEPHSISDILMEIDYVPESMSVQKLLGIFIKRHHAIAVVIDEFGGTAGMITIEDVLEEIFGEIEDEHDDNEMVEKTHGENDYVFSGRLEVDYLNKKYKLNIPLSDEYDTLAGYFISVHRGIPSVGQSITVDEKRIKVLRMSSSKIELLRITHISS